MPTSDSGPQVHVLVRRVSLMQNVEASVGGGCFHLLQVMLPHKKVDSGELGRASLTWEAGNPDSL